MKCEYCLAKTCHCVIDYILVILFLDGQTQGDGTSIGKCPNSLKCLSTGECRVCKVINSVHEGCSGATPYCDESSNPSTCISKHIATFFICFLLHLRTFITHTHLFFDNTGWSIQLGGETKLSGVSINNGVPIPATIAYTLEGNFFIVAGIEEPYLKMIKIFVTGETSFNWIEAKYSTPASGSNCRSQSSFTEACYQGTSNTQTAYNVQLVATKESGY